MGFLDFFRKQGEITRLMLAEHKKIFDLLDKFEKSLSEEDFQKLKEKQENHVFTEEKGIFRLYSKGKTYPQVTLLLTQHKLIKESMSNLKKSEFNNKEFVHFKKIMTEHIKLENEKFYPKLDSELNELEKNKILEKTNEYLLGNIAK